MSEPRLPFPVHGTRQAGDERPAGALGDAARLLYFTNLIADTAGVPTYQMQRQTPYGAVTASVNGPLAFKGVRAAEVEPEPDPLPEPEPTLGPARLVWLPEGFVITPRTPGSPDGFGMPPTPDGRGTPGGPLRQVIINRFRDNQYPDAVYRLAGGAADQMVYAANLFFMDWELQPGELRIGLTLRQGEQQLFLPQFDKRWVSLLREPDSGTWHCHRPQAHLQETPLEALVRQETNLIREEVGRLPLGPPLRGATGELSQNIAYQMRWSGIMEHNSSAFREGHRSFQSRVEERSSMDRTAGENLAIQYPADLDAFAVRNIMATWYNSPGHYANMVYDWAESNTHYAWIDPAVTLAGKATGPTGAKGVLGVQIFHGAQEWVAAGAGTHDARPPVTVAKDQDLFTFIYPSTASSDEFWPCVTYRGRVVYLTTESVNVHAMEVLSGTTLVEDGAETKLRVAVLHRPLLSAGLVYFVIYEGAVHDFLATRVELVRYQLPREDANFIARPRWSASGAKAIFCYTTLSDVPPGKLGGFNGFTPVDGASGVLGQTLHFMEFRGGSLFNLGSDQLTITPLTFGSVTGMTWHSQECRGECRLLAAYQGETPVFTTVAVDSASAQDSTGRYEKTLHGELRFPGGKTLVYVNIRTEPQSGGAVALKGFVRHLLPFDMLDPDGIAYLQYDLPETNADHLTGRLMIRGTQVMFAQDPTRRGSPGLHGEASPALSSAGQAVTLSAHRGATTAVSFLTRIRYAGVPSVPYPAVLVSMSQETAPRIMPRGPDWFGIGTMEYVLVGPTILADGLYDEEERYYRVERFRYARYQGEWLYAGRIENTLGGIGMGQRYIDGSWVDVPLGAWHGEDQYYYHSSLDLPAITGMPDLKKNILPIGVL